MTHAADGSAQLKLQLMPAPSFWFGERPRAHERPDLMASTDMDHWHAAGTRISLGAESEHVTDDGNQLRATAYN